MLFAEIQRPKLWGSKSVQRTSVGPKSLQPMLSLALGLSGPLGKAIRLGFQEKEWLCSLVFFGRRLGVIHGTHDRVWRIS